MVVEMGSTLKNYDQRYTVRMDATTNTWRILDMWHPALRTLSPDDDIPDDSEAVILVPDGAFIELVKEATKLGYLQNATVSPSGGILPEELEIVRNERDALKVEYATLSAEIKMLKERKPQSESFLLKEKIIDSFLKIAVSENINSLE